jgi:hypothetical protein
MLTHSSAEAEDSRGGRSRAQSLYVAKQATLVARQQEPEEGGSREETPGKRASPPPHQQQQRLTINLGAISAQRGGGGDHLRSSNSMPERGQYGLKADLRPFPSSARSVGSSQSSFKQPVTSASDERAVGKRMTVRKPVFLTGYLDSTIFHIGGTVSFRLIVNNMHKRPGTPTAPSSGEHCLACLTFLLLLQ